MIIVSQCHRCSSRCHCLFSSQPRGSMIDPKCFFFFIAKVVEIYRNRETRHECVPAKNSHRNKDRKTNILDLRTSNYGIICIEKCKKKIR